MSIVRRKRFSTRPLLAVNRKSSFASRTPRESGSAISLKAASRSAASSSVRGKSSPPTVAGVGGIAECWVAETIA